jgi:hypothetical protein
MVPARAPATDIAIQDLLKDDVIVCHSELGFICQARGRFPRDTMGSSVVFFEISISFLFDSAGLLRGV